MTEEDARAFAVLLDAECFESDDDGWAVRLSDDGPSIYSYGGALLELISRSIDGD